jgi:hypothetical protein
MSQRFVSGGSLDKPTERDEEWLKAEQELENKRREKAELAKKHDGKSLFEVLEANKGDYSLDFQWINRSEESTTKMLDLP